MNISRSARVVIAGLVLVSASLATVSTASADDDFRNIRVHLTNASDAKLVFESKTLDHGCWTEEPPATIEVGQTVDIASESCGVLTGTEFHAAYTVEGTDGRMTLHYSNPTAGEDTFDERAPQGYLFTKSGVIEDRTATFTCDSATCDGIPDKWKTEGVTIDPGGGKPAQFVDLPAMGATTDRPNVFIQLDWMADDSHNEQIPQASIDTVIDAFDKAPRTYPGATRPGINLIVDAGPDSTLSPGGAKWGDLSRARGRTWQQDFLTGTRKEGFELANFYTLLRDEFVPTGRLPIFHYSIAAAGIASGECTSGTATPDLLGFMVTLGGVKGGLSCWRKTQDEQTGTFMHEFGHVLALDHSGGEGNADRVNYKPNYPSVMNYAWQFTGVYRGGNLMFDFSREQTDDVDETKLTEPGGVTFGPNLSGYGTTNSCGVKDKDGNVKITSTTTQPDLKPVDWNCDGNPVDPGPGFDANGDTVTATLKGSASDWNRIKFKTGAIGAGANAKDTVTIPGNGRTAPDLELTPEMAERIRVLPLTSALAYTGSTTAAYHDDALMSAKLTDALTATPVVGKTVTFRLGSSSVDTCSAKTGAEGVASCSFKLTQAPNVYTITASYTGDSIYKASADTSRTFTITRKATTLTLTGATVILAGSTSTEVSAKLTEGSNADGSPPDPHGQPITFSLGDQSCTGTTNAQGVASCGIANVSGDTLGEKTLTATFAGDRLYLPSNASTTVIVFAFPSRGAFVLGDTTAAGATEDVTWWSDDWWTQNDVSGGTAPDAFKGFAETVTTLPTTTPANVCGTKFTTRPGNSPPPAADVPEYMGVLVADSVTKNGATVDGTWAQVVVVQTTPGYAPDPGHPGTGKIIATFCK